MSDVGKLERNHGPSADAADLADPEVAPSALEDPGKARQRVGAELEYRASGGRGGVAPMQRLMDERRAVGGNLAARVQRKAEGAPDAGVEVPEGGGAALPTQLQQRFAPKLGADLSDVRVHTGGASAQAAAGLGARAFTVGKDVHFNAGEFAPGSKEGDKLLAHELTHVVQGKKSGVQRKADEGADAKGHDGGGGGGGGAQGHAGQEAAPQERPAPISAKFIGVGRKIFRTPSRPGRPRPTSPGASPPPGGAAGAAPAATAPPLMRVPVERERADRNIVNSQIGAS